MPGRAFPVQCRCQAEKAKAAEFAEMELECKRHIAALRADAMANTAYRSYTFTADDGKTPVLTQTFKNFITNFRLFKKNGQGLLLWGNVGTGKTFYAMCIANELIDRCYNVKCTTLAAIITAMQDFESKGAIFDDLMRRDAIIIDDLGVERGTQFAMECVYNFVDGCNTNKIPLIITTNFTPTMLQKASEDTTNLTYARIYSRILERCYPVKVNEVKRRENNAKQNKSEMAKLLGVDGGN
jgi:DNA replication protein DnaC